MVYKKGHKSWNKGKTKLDLHQLGNAGIKKGYKQTEKHKINLSKSHMGQSGYWKGKLRPGKTLIKMSKSHKGKHHSNETKRKMSKSHKGKIGYWEGKHHSEKTKKKLRQIAFNYVKKTRNILYPCIGYNEKTILDKLEQVLEQKIIRQYKVEGYFLDGYILEWNLAIEVDERPKNTEKDITRQKIIENKLKCKFVRINDYD